MPIFNNIALCSDLQIMAVMEPWEALNYPQYCETRRAQRPWFSLMSRVLKTTQDILRMGL